MRTSTGPRLCFARWSVQAISGEKQAKDSLIIQNSPGNCLVRSVPTNPQLRCWNHPGRVKSDFADPSRVRFRTYALAKQYHHRFIERYGSVTCRDIQMKLFGRPYYLLDNDDYVKFEQAGGHRDKCPNVVGDAAGWLIELMAKEDLCQEGC